MIGSRLEMNAQKQPIAYLHVADDGTRSISVSSVPEDDPSYENNHILMREVGVNTDRPASISINILRNVLSAGGVTVVME